MAARHMDEPGVLETDAVLVRTLREEDLDAVVAIDGRPPAGNVRSTSN